MLTPVPVLELRGLCQLPVVVQVVDQFQFILVPSRHPAPIGCPLRLLPELPLEISPMLRHELVCHRRATGPPRRQSLPLVLLARIIHEGGLTESRAGH